MKKLIDSRIVLTSILLSMIVLNVSPLKAQSKRNHSFPEGGLSFQTGYWMPFGRMLRTFDPAPMFTLSSNGRIGFYLSYCKPSTKNTFTYNHDDTIFQAKAKNMISIGLKFSTDDELEKPGFFDSRYTSLGIGAVILNTDRNKVTCDDEYPYSADTIEISFLMSFRKKVFNSKGFVGVFGRYIYTPYNLFQPKVERGFGNTSVSVGLEVGF